MHKIPVIIDTDPGIDDFFALMLAGSAPELDIRAITAVSGNELLDVTAPNALDIASALNIDCPVAKGAAKPLNIEPITAGYIHGKNGLGDVQLEEAKNNFDNDYAWDVIYKEALKQDGKLEIIALGPLTNIAIALLKYPNLNKLINKITFMGGSSETGNTTPHGEFNILVDPLAADIVFKSEVPLVMVGLNATMKTMFTREDLSFIYNSQSSLSYKCSQMLDFLFEAYKKYVGVDAVVIHDALAVACVINPKVLETKKYYVAAETRSKLNFGRTVVDVDCVKTDCAKNCDVAINTNPQLMIELMERMMNFYK